MPTELRRLLLLALALPGACLVVACDREADAVRVYSAPKDAPPPPRVKPIDWTLPAGWTESPEQGPSQFGRYATIQVSPDDAAQVLTVNQVSSADLMSNLNRWEGQLGLPPSSPEDAKHKTKVIQVEAHEAFRVDLTGADVKTQSPMRMLAVILPEGDGAWSFLLKGAPEKVAAQEAAFDAFVASVRFPGHNHGPESDPHAGAATSQPADQKPYTLSGFTTPPGWEKDPTEREMRTATFFVGAGNDRAELMVVKLPVNRFGSMLMNVNRWRREVGLPDTDDEHKENVRESAIAGSNALVWDFAGASKRSYVGMVVKGADVWFIKLIGPSKTVEDQRANYDAFLQSLQFAEAGAK